MIVANEVIQLCLPFSGYGLIADSTKAPQPTLESLNAALRAQQLPQVIVLNQRVTIETADHTQTSTDPWTTKYVTFIPGIKQGNFLTGPIAEETNPPKQVMQAKQGHILVSKWGTVDPVMEITKGECNAFPSWVARDSCYRLDTEQNGASGLD